MKENKKIAGLIIGMIIVFLLIILVGERKTQLFSIGYKSIDIQDEYVNVRCEFGPKKKYETNYIKDIEKCVEEINNMKLRKTDWLDVILDSRTYDSRTYLGGEMYEMILEKADGGEDVFRFGVAGTGLVYYNGHEYMLKGKVPEYLMDICAGKVGKEFQKMVVQYKKDYVTITDEKDIKELEYLFDENRYTNEKKELGKGWIYKVIATEKDGEELEMFVVGTGMIIAPNGKAYEFADGINVKEIDKITGFERK